MKKAMVWTLLVALVAVLVAGCATTKQSDYGLKKDDWKKTQPPASWRGPGQPGGPPPGAASGPGVAPPTTTGQ